MNSYSPTTHNNLLSILDKQTKVQPNKPVFIMVDARGREVSLSYAMLEKKAKRVAAFLQLQQLENKTLLLIYPQSLDFIVAFFGCLYAKAIPVPAFPPVSINMAKRFSHIIKNANIQQILANQTLMQHMSKMKILNWSGQMPLLKSISNYLSHGVSPFLGTGLDLPWIDTSIIQEDCSFSYKDVDINPDEISLIQYTSGSLGDPKGVAITHANIMANNHAIRHVFAPDENSILFSWLPMFHDMGLIGSVLQTIYSDLLFIFISPQLFIAHPELWLTYISKYRATYSGGPNFAYQICVNKSAQIDKTQLDLSCWSTAYCGAEPIHSKTLKDFYKIFSKYGFKASAFLPCYGIAENTLLVSGNIKGTGAKFLHVDQQELTNGKIVPIDTKQHTNEKINKSELVSCGKVVVGTELVIVSTDKEILDECQIGEIWLRGQSLSLGYFKNKNATNEFFKCYTRDGLGPYFKTGDLGFLYQNELYVTGRCKDLIIIAGSNFAPQDIERTCEYAHTSIRKGSVAAFSCTTAQHEELHIALEIYKKTKKSTFDIIIQSIQSALSEEFQISAHGIYLLPEGGIVKTSSGKISRVLTKKNLLDGTLSIKYKYYNEALYNILDNRESLENSLEKSLSQAHETKDFLFKSISALLNRNLRKDEETVTFSHLGLDSFAMMKLVDMIETFTKKPFAPETLNDFPTINMLSHHLKNHVITTTDNLNNQDLLPNSLPHPQGNSQNEILTLKEWRQCSIENKIYTIEMTREDGPLPEVTSIKQTGERINKVSFSTRNYLGYSTHHEVINAAQKALDNYGLGVCDSPIAFEKLTIHKMFEDDLKNFFKVSNKSVSLFSSEYLALVGAINAYMQVGGMIFLDENSHTGLVDAAKTSGATYQFFKHNDTTHLNQLLEANIITKTHTLVCIEGLYSIDGDFGHVKDILTLCQKYNSKLLVDETHSILMAGPRGRGVSAEQKVLSQIDFLIGSLSTGFSGSGGFVFCHRDYAHYIDFYARNRMIYCSLSPAVIGGISKVLQLAQTTEGQKRQERLQYNCHIFHSLLRRSQIPSISTDVSWIVVIPVGAQEKLMKIRRDLQKHGLDVELIGYPFVPLDRTRLRLFISSEHTMKHFRQAIDILKQTIVK